jgi:membrane protease YdiL (CAAX protease family)
MIEAKDQSGENAGDDRYLPDSATQSTPSAKRYLEALGFVAAWMMLGMGLRLSGLAQEVVANAYLLIGIPLMMLFQLLVRKERLVALWIRQAERFEIGWVGFLMATIVAIMPAYTLAKNAWSVSLPLVVALWLGAAIIGAFGAGFCLCKAAPRTLRRGLPSFAIASAVGMLIMALAALAGGKSLWSLNKGLIVAQQFSLYFPVCFMLEEVVFRGMLDSHVQQPNAGSWSRWLSAVAVSLLWGLWHLPVVPVPDMLAGIIIAPVVCVPHILIGVPLSFCWRSSGSLLLPCAAHALIDAYRNAVLM